MAHRDSSVQNSNLKVICRSNNNPVFEVASAKPNSSIISNAGWSIQSSISSLISHSHSGPTQVISTDMVSLSYSTASCYSSVSPAALSSTSGLGSSMSDPKSVDASPGEVATMPGNTSFSCPSGNGNSNHFHSDLNMMKTEVSFVNCSMIRKCIYCFSLDIFILKIKFLKIILMNY